MCLPVQKLSSQGICCKLPCHALGCTRSNRCKSQACEVWLYRVKLQDGRTPCGLAKCLVENDKACLCNGHSSLPMVPDLELSEAVFILKLAKNVACLPWSELHQGQSLMVVVVQSPTPREEANVFLLGCTFCYFQGLSALGFLLLQQG